jgi:hypothetical protein
LLLREGLRLLVRLPEGLRRRLWNGPLRRDGLPGAPPPLHRRAPASAAGRCAPQVIRRFVKAAFFT